MRLGTLISTALVTVVAASSLTAATPSYAAPAEPAPHVFKEKVVIGHSVRGRPITAWHRGEAGGPKVLLIAAMHGNEGAPRSILTSLRNGRQIHGINLWLVPVYNPDGYAAHTRQNAHGVDPNRNYPYRWADLDGSYESGPRAGSEPETQAMMRFLRKIRPDRIISFHQPLDGVDTDTKNQAFSVRVARALNLQRKSFTCGGVCHGTMTGWFNHHFRGSAVTVEYPAHPGKRRMSVIAPRQVLSIFGATRGRR